MGRVEAKPKEGVEASEEKCRSEGKRRICYYYQKK
jgi:hypothetical protein